MKYGIDLGTTNSCIASMEEPGVRIYQSGEQANVTPSAVQMLKSQRLIVGAKAYEAMVDEPTNVAIEFKRWMGQTDTFTFPAAGRVLNAEALSAEVLKSLKESVVNKAHEDVRAAVITVPAAFTTRQCEATSRAAKLAGIEECFLLQEPIAAALAYGAKPGSRDQRWLIFDLGGGTLDIAVVSTRDGMLNVLEHGGNNLHGGKDIDRVLVESVYLPRLRSLAAVPSGGAAYESLVRALARKAERDKIALSTAQEVTVYFDDMERHLSGEALDLTFILKRTELERVIERFLEKCLGLATEVLNRAKLTGADLDRVLLVGGPTQMPIMRSRLRDHIGAEVDWSMDPMTVVAHGAAIFAITVEEHGATKLRATAPGDQPTVQLEYDRISSAEETSVYGKVIAMGATPIVEVRISSDNGFWTSGWVPVQNGAFELVVKLQLGKRNHFLLEGRDRSGRVVTVDPGSIVIGQQELVPTAPPLPHSIGLDVIRPDGTEAYDVIFHRNTPLPMERTVKYLARETIRPDEPDGKLAIKIREGDEESAEANHWLCNVYVHATSIRRPLPLGSELDLTIRIDQSRRLSMDIFIPHLNQHLSENVYLPAEEQPTGDVTSSAFDGYITRLDEVDGQILEDDRLEPFREEAVVLREEMMDLDEKLHTRDPVVVRIDPDYRVRLDAQLREVLARLHALERKVGVTPGHEDQAAEATEIARAAIEVAEQHGTALEKREAAVLKGDLERSLARKDDKSRRKAIEGLKRVRWQILFRLPETWENAFQYLRKPNRSFTNRVEADRWLRAGDQALEAGNAKTLQEAVLRLWELQPPTEAERAKGAALRSGIGRL